MADGSESTYDARDIKVLPGIEGVRKRPAMYIGDTSVRGLHHLVEEVVANSIDEAMAGCCSEIHVQLNADGSVTVTDNGRGIPVDTHPSEGKPAVEVIMTMLHAGGKFDNKAYKVAGGLHGIGVSVVNALSEWLSVEVRRDGKVYHQTYERGKTTAELKVIGKSKTSGTTITFKPDPEVFSATTFNFDTISNRMRELAFLNRGVRITLRDEDTEREREFRYDGGLKAFVAYLNEGRNVLHKDVIFFAKEAGGIVVEVAMQYNDAYSENVFSFANNINTIEGGTHLFGFRSALTRTFNAYARKGSLVRGDKLPQGEDIREGLTAVISVKLAEPQFEGQTKTKLGNREVQGHVEAIVNEELGTYLEENPKTAKAILEKAVLAAEARESARKARELTRRKSVLSSGSLPAKLHDCSSHEIESTELFIVEGQSAGGNAKQCRDARFQAILPLQGKILNVEKARVARMLAHDEIQTLILALGTGIGGEDFDISKRRYGKVIIMTDADVDGAHIRTLLLTFFFRHMPELIRQGCIYLAQPPLYRVRRRKREQYYVTDQEFRAALVELGADGTELTILGDPDRSLSGEEFGQLVELLRQMEEHERTLRKHNIPLRAFLAERRDDGSLPRFRISVAGEHHYAHTEEEVRAIATRIAATRDSQEVEDGEAVLNGTLSATEIHESRDIAKTLARLEQRGFPPQAYYPDADPDAPPRYRLECDGDSYELGSITEIAPIIRRIGEKGLQIQRYKGLGEMNPEQLGETTMDPATRTLLRVQLEDAVEADRLFSLLMGSSVQERREFIETHALEATNLDI